MNPYIVALYRDLHPLAAYDGRAIMAKVPFFRRALRRALKAHLASAYARLPEQADLLPTHYLGFRWMIAVAQPWPFNPSKDMSTRIIEIMLRRKFPKLAAKCALLERHSIAARDMGAFLAALDLWQPRIYHQGGIL